MQRNDLIGIGAGFVATVLFGSAAASTAFAGILFYLCPLPLCLAGLAWSTRAAALAAITATLLLSLILGPAVGLVFALTLGAPMVLFCYLLLLCRTVPGPSGSEAPGSSTQQATPSAVSQDIPPAAVPAQAQTGPQAGQQEPETGIEWYPPGRLVGWASLVAGGLAAILVLVISYDSQSFHAAIRTILQSKAFHELDPKGTLLSKDNIDRFVKIVSAVLPAAFAVVWLTISLLNLWLAGLIARTSGRALRPWPKLDELELPNIFFVVFVIALIGSFLPGIIGRIAIGFAGALLIGFVLQGLAVIHAATRGMAARPVLLAVVYLAILLLGWVAILVAILGLAEPMLNLRGRLTEAKDHHHQ